LRRGCGVGAGFGRQALVAGSFVGGGSSVVVRRWWFVGDRSSLAVRRLENKQAATLKYRNPIRVLVGAAMLVALAALPCFASEVAVLKNGFNITHQRRAILGNVTRLYVSSDGANYVDIPTEQIDHYEAGLDTPAPSVASFARNAQDGPSTSKNNAAGFPLRPKADLSEVVNEASDRYRLDPDLVNSVIKAESGFNVRAVSPKGARGLMQLMPGTAAQLGVPDTFDPQANVEGGARYLRELLERYNFDLVKALAAYNAGPQRVEQFGGVPPFHETRAYVAKVVRDFNKKKTAQQKTAPSTTSAQEIAHNNKPAPKTHVSAGTSQNTTPRVQASAAKPASD
jgi:soluble lytic murein transglycosylase-like protein